MLNMQAIRPEEKTATESNKIEKKRRFKSNFNDEEYKRWSEKFERLRNPDAKPASPK